MPLSPFKQMQNAVDIVNTSPHPKNKIAATIFGQDAAGCDFSISRTNFWPQPIAERIGTETRIGNASGTVHAETACLLAASYTEGASLCVTDPFCPNCAKNIAEAGIKTLYVDHKGFDKDFIARREHAFANMSMQICEKAGISVYRIWRKEQRIEAIFESPAGYVPPEENPVVIDKMPKESFTGHIKKAKAALQDVKCAIAFATDDNGQTTVMTARDHPVTGYTLDHDIDEIENPQGKYSFIQEPVNRLLMAAVRHGLKITDGDLYCSQVPTSREQVNIVGAGITHIHIGDKNKARDKHGLLAMKQLQNGGVLNFIFPD